MIKDKNLNIKAKGEPYSTPLYNHLEHIKIVTEKFAEYIGLDVDIAGKGAILHDIGKTSTIFQNRLKNGVKINDEIFRHEIASIFFISLFDKKIYPELIEMVISHHKSIIKDKNNKGLFDLIYDYGEDKIFEMHSKDFEIWSKKAVEILGCFNIKMKEISIKEAKNNFLFVIDYCKNNVINEYGFSKWKGLLMGGDYFSSALNYKTSDYTNNIFKKPILSFYNRKNDLYPLSLKSGESDKRHTIVTASTGSGKTDFLLKRCKNRVFYILPYTASINAMYNRIKNDIKEYNPNLDIRVLHSSSKIQIKNNNRELKNIQSKIGSSIKIMTPHQIANSIFGIKGYESTLLDLQGSDVILDEIHTYSDKLQGMVLKIIEILKFVGCNIHIGTATLPTILYNKILDILDVDNVYQVKLLKKEMKLYDRHKIFKREKIDKKLKKEIRNAINNKEKILIVKNRVSEAQDTYDYFKEYLKKKYPKLDILLLHSRYKRKERNEIEKKLLELNDSNKPCVVISTQVVEVSLDISFDMMITDCSPIDSLIQRFGRINRKRDKNSIGKYKKIYVLAPPDNKYDALPYSLDVVKKTYDILPNGKILREIDIQKYIDQVYQKITFTKIDNISIFNNNKFDTLVKLQNNSKSIFFDNLDINSVNVILDSDIDEYSISNYDKKIELEIPVSYFSIKKLNLPQLNNSENSPLIIGGEYYDENRGLDLFNISNNKNNII